MFFPSNFSISLLSSARFSVYDIGYKRSLNPENCL